MTRSGSRPRARSSTPIIAPTRPASASRATDQTNKSREARMKITTLLSAIAIGCAPAAAWELPPDNGTMGRDTIAAILAANDYPETSGYRQDIDFIDFSSNGQ